MDSPAEERAEVPEPKPNHHTPSDETVPLAPSCPCPWACCLKSTVASARISPSRRQEKGLRLEINCNPVNSTG